LVLRLYPAIYGSGNAVWESTIQNVLAAAGYPVARSYLLCTDLQVLGGAFFIMDFLPGELLVSSTMDTVPGLIGRSHAALHRIDPQPLIEAIQAGGVEQHLLFLDHRFEMLGAAATKFPWLRKAVDWLLERRPPEPAQRAVCHGDFHPLNILVQDGRVSGVLDWPGFLVADPVLDVANTIMLSTIPFKHLAPTLGLDPASLNMQIFVEGYLQAYQAGKPLDRTHLDYYQVRRCVNALLEGAQGQSVWRHPPIVADLLAYIHSVTGISIKAPG
jgi:aminoglycoside phosphotransferase (APT) family kinase protein